MFIFFFFFLAEQREDVVDDVEMENYLVCVMALQRLMQSERVLMAGIIPLSHQPHVFETIVAEAIDSIVQEGEVIYKKNRYSLLSFNVLCTENIVRSILHYRI